MQCPLDGIRDQHDAVLVANTAQRLQEIKRRHIFHDAQRGGIAAQVDIDQLSHPGHSCTTAQLNNRTKYNITGSRKPVACTFYRSYCRSGAI